MAIPTGIGSDAANAGLFDVEKQVQWLMQGRCFKRVIVENERDKALFSDALPVLSIFNLFRPSGTVLNNNGGK